MALIRSNPIRYDYNDPLTNKGDTEVIGPSDSVKSALLKAAMFAAPFAASAIAPAAAGAGGATSAAAGAGAGAGTAASTGGVLSALGKLGNTFKTISSVASPVLSTAAKYRADSRAADAEYGLNRDRLELLRYQALLDMMDEQRKARQDAVMRATRGGLLEGMQDPTITPPPQIPMGQITGGLKPSAIVGRSELGSELRRSAMMDLLNPHTPQVPELSDQPTPSWIDKALGIGATAFGAYDNWRDLKRRTMPTPTGASGYDIGRRYPNLLGSTGASYLPR